MAHRRLIQHETAADPSAGLAEAQALNHRHAENHTQSQQTFVADRGRARHHELDLVKAKLRLHFLEHQRVPQRVVQLVRTQKRLSLPSTRGNTPTFALYPISNSIFVTPPVRRTCEKILSVIRLNNRGTDGNTAGWRCFRSSSSLVVSP